MFLSTCSTGSLRPWQWISQCFFLYHQRMSKQPGHSRLDGNRRANRFFCKGDSLGRPKHPLNRFSATINSQSVRLTTILSWRPVGRGRPIAVPRRCCRSTHLTYAKHYRRSVHQSASRAGCSQPRRLSRSQDIQLPLALAILPPPSTRRLRSKPEGPSSHPYTPLEQPPKPDMFYLCSCSMQSCTSGHRMSTAHLLQTSDETA